MAGLETGLRDAHLHCLELSLALRQAQSDAGLSPTAAHQLFSRFDAALVHISAAIGEAAPGHVLARALAVRLGLDPVGYGATCPPDESDEEYRRHTSSAAAA